MRSDGIICGKIKKERAQGVYPAFLPVFQRLYEMHKEYLAGRDFEKDYWFTDPGEYVFTITEQKLTNHDPGYTPDPHYSYDTKTYTKTVTITKNQSTGNLEKSVSVTPDTTIKFVNPYTPTPVTDNLKVKKVIESDDANLAQLIAEGLVPDVEFEFTLTAGDATPNLIPVPTDAKSPMPTDPADAVRKIKASDALADNAAAIATFGDIEFTAAGTYHYTIKEKDESNLYPMFAYYTDPIDVTVTVSDTGTALKVDKIEYSIGEDDKYAEITNEYVLNEVTFTPSVKKIFKSYTNVTYIFTFELYEGKEATGTPLKVRTITMKGSPSGLNESDITPFPGVTITAAGTTYYTVVEKASAYMNDNWVHDETAYTYEVTTGWASTPTGYVLTITSVVPALDEEHPAEPAVAVFTNEFDLKGECEPEITKEMVGRDLTEDDDFVFVIRNSAGTEVARGHSDATGKVTWNHKLEYTLKDLKGAWSKIFMYKIYEVVGDETGVTYGAPTNPTTVEVYVADYTVVVTQIDDINATELDIEDGVSGSGVFTNYFHANGEWNPVFFKDLQNRHMLLNLLNEYE